MKKKTQFGWLELVLGVLLVALGVFTFVEPTSAFTSFVFVYGLFAILTGVADILLCVRIERRVGLGPVTALVGGIFSILAGVVLLIFPGAGGWALAILFPVWFIAHCIVRLANLGFTRAVAGTAPFVVSLIANILGLVLGVLLIFNPFASAVTLSYVVGFYLLLLGIGSIVMAFGRRRP